MNIPSKISDNSFPLLWKDIMEEGKKTKKVSRINSAITIFSQILFAITIMLFGIVVLYFLFKNDNVALFIKNTGINLIQFIPATIPDIVKIIIWLILALITPAVCCIFVRFVFSLFGAKYKNEDIGKDGLEGAKAIEKAISEFKKERKHYDITWELPEDWKYNLIFSITFLLPVFIQLYLLADKTNAEGIVSLILMTVLFGGIGGLILLLPIAGLKAISNFLCNKTCVFLTNSKEKEYDYAIEVLSKYIRSTEREIKAKEEAEYKRIEKERLSKEKDELLNNVQMGQQLYNEAMSKEIPDEELMKKAAKLGSGSACYYLGKKLLSKWKSDIYTSTEKKEIASEAAKYFDVARQMAALLKLDIKTECEFLWLYSRLQYENNGEIGWQKMLNAFREIQQSGNLAKEYTETLNSAIKSVVHIIDKLDSSPTSHPAYESKPQQPPPSQPVLMEKTIYYDWRTGEPLYYDSNRNVVNSKGEEVASSWWD